MRKEEASLHGEIDRPSRQRADFHLRQLCHFSFSGLFQQHITTIIFN